MWLEIYRNKYVKFPRGPFVSAFITIFLNISTHTAYPAHSPTISANQVTFQ